MSTDDLVHVYLVGKTTCPYTQHATQDLAGASRSDPSQKVQQYPINDVVSRVYCDQIPSDPSVPQGALCSMVKNVPTLLACQRDQCSILVDGYFPDYASRASQATNLFLYNLQE